MSVAFALDAPAARPLLKWTGSKLQIKGRIADLLGPVDGRYHEPFVGGASVFLELRRTRPCFQASLSDANARLIRTYRGVRDAVGDVVRLLRDMPYERAFYLRTRALDPDGMNDADLAAWTIYLNKTGFNGLYRVNKAGRFNVPFGRYDNPTVCDEPNLAACSEALTHVDLDVLDFGAALDRVENGDTVYLDPPYVPLSATANFRGYTSDGFAHADQVRLRDAAARCGMRGVRVVLSNSDCSAVRKLYSAQEGFRVHEIEVRRSMSCRAETRGKYGELLIEWVGRT